MTNAEWIVNVKHRKIGDFDCFNTDDGVYEMSLIGDGSQPPEVIEIIKDKEHQWPEEIMFLEWLDKEHKEMIPLKDTERELLKNIIGFLPEKYFDSLKICIRSEDLRMIYVYITGLTLASVNISPFDFAGMKEGVAYKPTELGIV